MSFNVNVDKSSKMLRENIKSECSNKSLSNVRDSGTRRKIEYYFCQTKRSGVKLAREANLIRGSRKEIGGKTRLELQRRN